MNKAQLLAGLCICMLFVVTGCQAESVTTTVHSTATVTAPVQTVTVTNTVISTVTETITVTSTAAASTSTTTTSSTTTSTNTVISSVAGINTEVVWFDEGDDWFYAFSYKTQVTSTGITVSGFLGNKGLSKVAILSVNADLYDINDNIIGTTDTLDISHNVESATPKFTLTYEISDTSIINRVVINVHCDYA